MDCNLWVFDLDLLGLNMKSSLAPAGMGPLGWKTAAMHQVCPAMSQTAHVNMPKVKPVRNRRGSRVTSRSQHRLRTTQVNLACHEHNGQFAKHSWDMAANTQHCSPLATRVFQLLESMGEEEARGLHPIGPKASGCPRDRGTGFWSKPWREI